MPDCSGETIGVREVSQLAALNETLRDDYIEDCQECCRPIAVSVRVDGAAEGLRVRREDDT